MTELHGLQDKSLIKVPEEKRIINYKLLREEEEYKKKDDLEKLMSGKK